MKQKDGMQMVISLFIIWYPVKLKTFILFYQALSSLGGRGSFMFKVISCIVGSKALKVQ